MVFAPQTKLIYVKGFGRTRLGKGLRFLTWVVWGGYSAKEIFEYLKEVRKPACGYLEG